MAQQGRITKSTTTAMAVQQEASDSVIELVDNVVTDGEAESLTTIDMEEA